MGAFLFGSVGTSPPVFVRAGFSLFLSAGLVLILNRWASGSGVRCLVSS